MPVKGSPADVPDNRPLSGRLAELSVFLKSSS
jgi:hypothetical protein